MSCRKILFVDDEPDLASLVEQQFEGKIFEFEVEVIFAENGVEALKKLDENKDVEIVLSDINMPIMDGLEFLGKATKLDRLLKIVMVSAYSDMPNIRKAMNKGAYDFVTKPVDFDDLNETIARVLRKIDQIKAETQELNRLKEIEKEMEMARKIQTSLLPSSFTPFILNTSFEIFGSMIPARIVGGDFYDFFPSGTEKLILVMGETSAHGMPAAMYISSAREAIRSFAAKNLPLENCIKEINSFLFFQKREGVEGLNLFFGIFDINQGVLDYCVAGVPNPLIISKEGKTTPLALEKSSSLGLSQEAVFPIKQITLGKEETLALFTKGVVNEKNSKEEFYSTERLQAVVTENHALPITGIADKVIENVRAFIAPAEQGNDYTLLLLKFKGQ